MSYSMVHDMRAPLRAMQSFAEIMQEGCADCQRPPGLDYLHRIRESSNRLDRLITDALSYNKVVRENLPVTPVDIGKLLRGMVQTYPNLQPPAAEITLAFEELWVLGNESLLTQCFGNLLDNAVKFVAPGVRPRVRVRAELVESGELLVDSPGPSPSGHQPSTMNHLSSKAQPAKEDQLVRIYIEDNGIGIPKDAQERIFRMFQRMHPESDYSGTGIGLAIVRKAVERMNGRLGLESEPGQGSRFWVELPGTAEAKKREPFAEAA
jgi:signal transduction histidine kinase